MVESAKGSVVDVRRVLESSDRLSNKNRLRVVSRAHALPVLANEVMIYFA